MTEPTPAFVGRDRDDDASADQFTPRETAPALKVLENRLFQTYAREIKARADDGARARSAPLFGAPVPVVTPGFDLLPRIGLGEWGEETEETAPVADHAAEPQPLFAPPAAIKDSPVAFADEAPAVDPAPHFDQAPQFDHAPPLTNRIRLGLRLPIRSSRTRLKPTYSRHPHAKRPNNPALLRPTGSPTPSWMPCRTWSCWSGWRWRWNSSAVLPPLPVRRWWNRLRSKRLRPNSRHRQSPRLKARRLRPLLSKQPRSKPLPPQFDSPPVQRPGDGR
ncbi:hypothetical protein ACFSTD_20555 [Novosphingobium colocasiae]